MLHTKHFTRNMNEAKFANFPPSAFSSFFEGLTPAFLALIILSYSDRREE